MNFHRPSRIELNSMNPKHLMTPIENISITMSNQSIGVSLTSIGKGWIRLDLKTKDLNNHSIS
jgi:hypothetical protein